MRQRNKDGMVEESGPGSGFAGADEEREETDVFVLASNDSESAETVLVKPVEETESLDGPLTQVYRPDGKISSGPDGAGATGLRRRDDLAGAAHCGSVRFTEPEVPRPARRRDESVVCERGTGACADRVEAVRAYSHRGHDAAFRAAVRSRLQLGG